MAEVKDYSANALLRKEKEVELDTDGLKDQDIEIKEEIKKDEDQATDLNRGEVDLGYTDHPKKEEEKEEEDDKKKPQIEITEEPEEKNVPRETSEEKDEKPNLLKHNKDYQKRIDKLVFQKKEAERRENAALEYAKGLKSKYDDASSKFMDTDIQYLKELDARVDAQREQVKVAMKQAIEANDPDKLTEANDKLTQLAVEKEKARLELANREEAKKVKQETQTTNVESETSKIAQTPAQITPKAKQWAQDNPWFGTDEVMTNAAITIHNNIAQEGIAVDSDEYYNEVKSRLDKYFPGQFDAKDEQPKKEQQKPVQTVASAGRTQQGRRTVKLTKSQVAIANRLGVPLEEYARYVKEDK